MTGVDRRSHVAAAPGGSGAATPLVGLLSREVLHGVVARGQDGLLAPVGIQQLNGVRHAVHPLPGDAAPRYYAGTAELDEQADGYLEVHGTKGYVWVNGFCLGRYWNRGPQQRLYLPWPATRAGANEIVVLELDRLVRPAVSLHPRPDLGSVPV